MQYVQRDTGLDMSTTTNDNDKMDLNYAAVLGAVITGNGYAQVTEWTSAMDISFMSERKYQKIEEKVGNDIISTAEATMKEAIDEEKEAAFKRGDVDTDGFALITVVTDGVWGKRSYGNGNFSSMVGCATIIGFHTKKVLWMDVKNKYCLVCVRNATKKKSVPEHLCNANYKGSSTGMEHTILVEGFKACETLHKVRFHKFIADGDSNVYRKLLDARPYINLHIEKIECRNHLFRNYRKKMISAAKNTKIPIKSRKLIGQHMLRIQSGIKRAIAYHKNEDLSFKDRLKKLRTDIGNAPYHTLGDHTNCDDYFCKSKSDTCKDKVNELKTNGTFTEIEKSISRLVTNAESLLYDVDSNIVEKFNSIIAKFVGGKRVNYAGG